ncbi:PHP domain-containing protein [Terrabacter aeriphilus]|uniref:PHP domain-containing protein n=1 Tax=Terrabacter aeriphilus TaxID=515662 RepID=A0ABP9J1Q9_9MICO
MLTADSHVHSEWSWDTGGPDSGARGTMVATCEQALRIGLPALIFTEHFDVEEAWRAGTEEFPPAASQHINEAGYLVPPPLDVEGYFGAIAECRRLFPDLTILSGVEFGQPHLVEHRARQLVDLSRFDRVNGSLHTLRVGPDRAEPITLYRHWGPDEVMDAYLDEVPAMLASDAFEVFTHLDYAVRHWPVEQAGRFDPRRFEGQFRVALRAVAESGRALEMNTRRLSSWLPQWWTEEGGQAVSFGSDAHVPTALAGGFPEAQHMLEHFGFRPGRRPEDLWTRRPAPRR